MNSITMESMMKLLNEQMLMIQNLQEQLKGKDTTEESMNVKDLQKREKQELKQKHEEEKRAEIERVKQERLQRRENKKQEIEKEKALKKLEMKKMKLEKKQDLENENDMSEYYTMRKKMEKRWFKLLEPVCYVQHKKNGKCVMRDATATNELMKHIRVNVVIGEEMKKVPFFKLWQVDQNIRRYEEVAYLPPPAICPKNKFNLYHAPLHKGKVVDIFYFHEQIRSMVNFDEVCYRYLIFWLADIIQFAGAHMRSHGTCIIFRGEQGGQKGNFFKLMEKLLGSDNACNTSDTNELIKSESNRFADSAVNKLFIAIDEVNSKTGHEIADKFKSMITNETIRYEKKGVQGVFEVPNFARYCGFTNHDNSFKIEYSDRRFVVFQTSTKYSGSAGLEFGAKLNELYSNSDFIYSVWHYLKNVQIPSDFNFKGDRPLTQAYHSMKAHNIPHTIRFVANVINEGNDKKRYTAQEFFNEFLDFIQANNFQSKYTSITFYNTLKELSSAGINKIKNSSMMYTIDAKIFKEYCRSKKYQLFEDEEDDITVHYPKSLSNPVISNSKVWDIVGELKSLKRADALANKEWSAIKCEANELISEIELMTSSAIDDTKDSDSDSDSQDFNKFLSFMS